MAAMLLWIVAGWGLARALAAGGKRASAGAAFALGLGAAVLLGAAALWAGIPLAAVPWMAAAAGGIGWIGRGKLRPVGGKLPPARQSLALLVLKGAIAFGVLLAAIRVGFPILNYDVLSYHLPLAMDVGSAFAHPGTFYARLPLGVPVIEQAVVRGFGGPWGVGIQLLLAAALFATASSAARCAAWLGGRAPARTAAAALVLLHPMLTNSLMQALSDGLVALMAVASAEFLLAAGSRSGRARHASIGAALAATAAALKMNAAGTVLVPWFAALAMVCAVRRHRVRAALSLLLPAASAAFLVLVPWLARAALLGGGNPLFPFQGEGPGWIAAQGKFVVEVHDPSSPLEVVWWLDLHAKNATLGYPLLGVSALLAAALAALFAGCRLRRAAYPLLAMAVLGYLAWLGVRGNPARFLSGTAALLCPLAAVGCFARWRMGSVAGLLGCAVAFAAVRENRDVFSREGLRPMYRAADREAALDLLGDGFLKAVRSARDADDGGRLLLFFEARPSLFHPARAAATSVWDQPLWAQALRSPDSTVEGLARALRAEGYTRIFVNEFEWGRLMDFYSGTKAPGAAKWMGHLGIAALDLSDDEIRSALAAYPPHRFAGMEPRQIDLLFRFLKECRKRAAFSAPAGPGAEIWWAAIP